MIYSAYGHYQFIPQFIMVNFNLLVVNDISTENFELIKIYYYQLSLCAVKNITFTILLTKISCNI